MSPLTTSTTAVARRSARPAKPHSSRPGSGTAYHRANPILDPTVHPEHDLTEEPGDVG
jgi:hypothetical protein